MIKIILSLIIAAKWWCSCFIFFEKQYLFYYNRSLEKMQSFFGFVFNLFGIVQMTVEFFSADRKHSG
ncbi:MAG TPA: hypothetical protein DCM18_00565 [Ruminococcus sp.]|jgi:hypothetical protein|nr:hypothetical protein [Ruminococcus sp.]